MIIPLTRGLSTVIDDDDWILVSGYRWQAVRRSFSGTECYVAQAHTPGNHSHSVLMHRVILGLTTTGKSGTHPDVDHISMDTLDNRRVNLRAASRSQNKANQRAQNGNRTGYKGVSVMRRCARWRADIGYQGRVVYLGSFRSPEDAARAYDAKARELFGEYAHVNFP